MLPGSQCYLSREDMSLLQQTSLKGGFVPAQRTSKAVVTSGGRMVHIRLEPQLHRKIRLVVAAEDTHLARVDSPNPRRGRIEGMACDCEIWAGNEPRGLNCRQRLLAERPEAITAAVEVAKDMDSVAATLADGTLKPGYIRDYVSGIPVKASPEEVEAVQVFSQRLVEDYSYPKGCIQTRPQFRVRVRPSDEARAFPVDIAVV